MSFINKEVETDRLKQDESSILKTLLEHIKNLDPGTCHQHII